MSSARCDPCGHLVPHGCAGARERGRRRARSLALRPRAPTGKRVAPAPVALYSQGEVAAICTALAAAQDVMGRAGHPVADDLGAAYELMESRLLR